MSSIESAVRSALAGTPYQQLGPVDEGGGITIVVGGGGSFWEDMSKATDKLVKAGLHAISIGARIFVSPMSLSASGDRCLCKPGVESITWRDGRVSIACKDHGPEAMEESAILMIRSVDKLEARRGHR